jgi:hypothetical protein
MESHKVHVPNHQPVVGCCWVTSVEFTNPKTSQHSIGVYPTIVSGPGSVSYATAAIRLRRLGIRSGIISAAPGQRETDESWEHVT